MENLDIKALEVIEKSKPAQLGEVRTWGGKEYIKTPRGWRPKPKGYKDEAKKETVEKIKGEIINGGDLKPGDVLYDWEDYDWPGSGTLSQDAKPSGIVSSVKPLKNGFGEVVGARVVFKDGSVEEMRGDYVVVRK